MAEYRLLRRVEEVAGRLQQLGRLKARSRTWLLTATAGLLLLLANSLLVQPVLSPTLTIVGGMLLLGFGALTSLRVRSDVDDAAHAIEARHSDLDSRLVTAVAQRPDYEVGGFSFLQHEVLSQTLLHAQRHDWRDVVPPRTLAAARLRQALTLAMCVVVFAAAAWAGRRPFAPETAHTLAGQLDANSVDDEYGLRIEPGNIELERGTPLLVLARFNHQLPNEVTLVTSDAEGMREEVPLSRSLEDPLFGGRIASVQRDLTYHVTFDEGRSDDFRVKVFDYPQLQQADATIEYPQYTGMEVETIEDVRHVSVVEGSKLTLSCLLNKPVATARLVGEQETELALTADEQQPQRVAVTWTPDQRQTLTLELIDEARRHNKQPPQFVIDVIPNQPPDLKVAFPAKDMRVSPLQELALEAEVRDDFGVKEYGLVYQLPAGDEQTLKLGGEAEPDAQVQLAHEMSFEQINAQPNELVAYYFYADDVGPTGDTRRTLSNMYFAEVRHFDEIYRQVVPTGQGEGNMPCTKLLELQRDIVTATWNLVRREQDEPSAKLPDDAGTIAESQSQALEIAQQMQATLEDLLSQQYLAEAIKQMRSGEGHLTAAAETPAVPPLADARVSTQAAYAALLKLQARETLVKQCQGGKCAAPSTQQRLNDQLSQLELKNNRNRYEQEKQDQPQADRESLQVLNRLRELARRQGDLNEKIQELENALRAAQSQEEKDEIQRQLKRLQEEQQQLLRDLDETKERMDRPQNRSRMAEARQQVEQTRQHLLQTKESLQAGQVSKAFAEGTRAERELEDLKDQFRDAAAGQFADTMRELRDQVRELAESEEELSEQLAQSNPDDRSAKPDGSRPQLRDPERSPSQLSESVAKQQEKLTDVMQSAEQIVRESEFSEPLLSKKLYDAVRGTRVDQPEESLAMTGQFLKLGLHREASQAEQQARQGIDKLREGVEQAAQSVLGNEAASLERAREELDELAMAIAAELAQADPKQAEKSQELEPSDARSSGKPEGSQSEKPGQAGTLGDQKSGTEPGDKPGEASPGQSQNPGEKPGEGQAGQHPGSKPGQGASGEGRPAEDTSGAGQGSEGTADEKPGSRPGRGQGQTLHESALAAVLQQGTNHGGGTAGPHLGPLTSGEFVEWSDRMRDVEEMLEHPDLRAQVARIRDRAREMRIEVKRHSKEPDWQMVRTSIYGPMLELQDRLAEELARLEPDSEEFVPLDRDPVPDRYAEVVRHYYERLGSGR